MNALNRMGVGFRNETAGQGINYHSFSSRDWLLISSKVKPPKGGFTFLTTMNINDLNILISMYNIRLKIHYEYYLWVIITTYVS